MSRRHKPKPATSQPEITVENPADGANSVEFHQECQVDSTASESESGSVPPADDHDGGDPSPPEDSKIPLVSAPRIYLTADLFLPVDKDGYYLGQWCEGRLGCVLAAYRVDGESRLFEAVAIKIPRLTADTLRENAYICQLFKDESHVVDKQNRRTSVAPLIRRGADRIEVIRGPLLDPPDEPNKVTPDSALGQRDGTIFVRFESQKPPRFIAVLANKNGTYPGQPEELKQAMERLQDFKDRKQAYFAPLSAHTLEAKIRPLESEMAPAELLNGWYVNLPAISLEWCPSTLEEAISRGAVCKWSVADHLILIRSVSEAVQALHTPIDDLLMLLHCDIRPANIMASTHAPGQVFEDSWKVPARHYKLGDYGTFSDPARIGFDRPAGHTVAGRDPSQTRGSRFYAPERRKGEPSEAVNYAVICKSLGKDGYLVQVGWSSGQISREAALASLRKLMPEPCTGEKILHAGDTIRLRDYLFTVTRELVAKDSRVFECSARVGRVVHERLVLVSDCSSLTDNQSESLCPGDEVSLCPGDEVLSVGEYIQFHQWTAATDVYSVGVLLLYLLIARGKDESDFKQPQTGAERLKAEFEEFMDFLESAKYFRAHWQSLKDFARAIEKKVELKDKGHEEGVRLPWADSGSETLAQHADAIAEGIRRTTPHSGTLFKGVDQNTAHFLLVLHFALSCIHRRDSIKAELDADVTKDIVPADIDLMPFCENRRDNSHDCIARVVERVERLSDVLSWPSLKLFKPKVPSVGFYDSVKELAEANRKMSESLEEIQRVKKECEERTRRSEDLEKENGELRQRMDDFQEFLKPIKEALGAVGKNTNYLKPIHDAIESLARKSDISNNQKEIEAVSKACEELIKQVKLVDDKLKLVNGKLKLVDDKVEVTLTARERAQLNLPPLPSKPGLFTAN